MPVRASKKSKPKGSGRKRTRGLSPLCGLISIAAQERLTLDQRRRMGRLWASVGLQLYLPPSSWAAARDYIVTGRLPKKSVSKRSRSSDLHSNSFA